MSLVGRIVAGEAATPLGQQAVINVLQNRAAQNFGGYGTTIEAQATAPLQFSAYPNALGASSASTEGMVSAANSGTLGNIVPNAVNYANPTVGNTGSVGWVASNVAGGQGVNVAGEGNVFWGPRGSSPGYDPSQAYNGGSGAIVSGPADQTSGANPNTTDPLGTSVTQNPSGTSSTTSAGAQGTPIQTSLQPEETSFITSTVNSIESAMGGGLTKTLTAAETAVATYLGGLQNWFIRAGVILLGVVLIAIALVVIMWDHGGSQVADRVVKVARA